MFHNDTQIRSFLNRFGLTNKQETPQTVINAINDIIMNVW